MRSRARPGDVSRAGSSARAVESLPLYQALALDQPDDGQHDRKYGDADQDQPVLQVRQEAL